MNGAVETWTLVQFGTGRTAVLALRSPFWRPDLAAAAKAHRRAADHAARAGDLSLAGDRWSRVGVLSVLSTPFAVPHLALEWELKAPYRCERRVCTFSLASPDPAAAEAARTLASGAPIVLDARHPHVAASADLDDWRQVLVLWGPGEMPLESLYDLMVMAEVQASMVGFELPVAQAMTEVLEAVR